MANRPRNVMLVQKQRFLEAFQRHGIIGRACDEAALRNKGGRVVVPGVERHTVARWAATDPEFATAFANARESAADYAEYELFRRAVEGTPRDVYYQGVVVGTTREYSDQLLLALVRRMRPAEWREQQAVDLRAQVRGQVGLRLGDEPGTEHLSEAAITSVVRALLTADAGRCGRRRRYGRRPHERSGERWPPPS